MKFTLNWLTQYVDWTDSTDQLADRLTMLGLEVEGVTKISGEFEGVVVAEVISRDKHPNADKLSLCRVRDGQGERQIVCGAQNLKPGDKVPLILPGASLPGRPGEPPVTIKVGKIRGVESHGMMCSPRELGLADDADGLLILDPAARVGQPFAEHLGRAAGDVLFDLETTPNRPDWNSVIGIAREIAAATGRPLRLPPADLPAPASPAAADGDHADRWVRVELRDPEGCPRYTARVIQGIQIGPSPAWLRNTLEKIGVRSINNVVDVTNYVMLETGQPLHAFDYRLLARSKAAPPGADPALIVVRSANAGETFVTLDGQQRVLNPGALLISDQQQPIALAGIMGGANTEIRDSTQDVLLESAYFDPARIRRTSKALGLRSESSYRFERGADLSATEWASRRAARLILETAGGHLIPGVVDACARQPQRRSIRLRHHRTDALLGILISPERQIQLLRSLEFEPDPAPAPGLSPDPDAGSTNFLAPTFRVDAKGEIDLIEEIARLHGVDNIPATQPRGGVGKNPADADHDALMEIRRVLLGLGLVEAQGQTLVSADEARLLSDPAGLVLLANPLSSDMNALRPSLIPGLLAALRHNLHHKTEDIRLFEIGRVFAQRSSQFQEERRLGLLLTGRRDAPFWQSGSPTDTVDLFDLKGAFEELAERLGLRGLAYATPPQPSPQFVVSALVSIGGKVRLGEFGLLAPAIAKHFDARGSVLVGEFNLDQVIRRRNPAKGFRPLAQFPAIRRDIAMVVPEFVTHEAVLQQIRRANTPNLEKIELFDLFRGGNLSPGSKSLAYALTYRHAERTLTDAEVAAAHAQVLELLKQGLDAQIRES